MDNALGPRDIQARIRAGQSLEEVGRVAGLPLDRVERFAAPVLAEREHVALMAMSSSVRRRGEASGHRVLRLAVSERLQKRGVDIDAVDWDAYRQSDGRWSVTADYQSGESHRRAQFSFDLQGRFSVAADDEARWLLGEQSSLKGPQPGRRRPVAVDSEEDPDSEPTLDLNDELALVRVVQSAPVEEAPGETDEIGPQVEASDQEESRAVYGGVSDASAVPETDLAGWEPGLVVDYPVEPGPEPEQAAEGPAPTADEEQPSGQAAPDSSAPAQTQEPAPSPTAEPAADPSAVRPAGKRKRASVPSWDEIMFGGPPRSG